MDERIHFLYMKILKHGCSYCTHPYKNDKSTPEVEVYFEEQHPHNGDWHWYTLFNLGDPPGTWRRSRNMRNFMAWERVK